MSTSAQVFVIDQMGDEDWIAVRAIYLEGIATGNATFERSAPEWEKWDAAHLVRGQRIGSELLNALVEASEYRGIWMLQAGMFPENTASISLHQWAGFRVVGIREKLGCMDGCWRDVILMERRSRIVGVANTDFPA